MKLRSKIVSAAAITIGTAAAMQPVLAQYRAPGEFYCGVNNSNPATLVEHPNRGEVVFINWKTNYFGASGWTPGVRCAEVSQRFQDYQQQGLLNYVVPGKMNGYPVVCAARNINDDCNGRLLFTLKPGADPSVAIAQLHNLNIDANASPLNQEASGLLSNRAGEKVLHVDSFLEVARVNNRVNNSVNRNPVSRPTNVPQCGNQLFGSCH